MAANKLRKGQAYRMLERAYTRKSRFRKKGYLKSVPSHRIVKFNMGNVNGDFDYQVDLYSKGALQIRHNSIESVRMMINRELAKILGVQEYYLMIRVYPHHAQRENKQMGGAHSDRIQTGMQKSFGKVVNVAALVKEGKVIFSAFVNKKGIETVRAAFKASSPRLPMKIGIEVSKIEK
jgi:large subunit ribosomal protein L10e